jgi:hypothetical protein
MATSKKKKLPAEEKILPAGGAQRPVSRSKSGTGAATLAQPKAGAERPDKPAEQSSPAIKLESISVSGKAAAMEFFRSQKPASDRRESCRRCSWAGELGDCREREMGPAGNGWEWYCPECGDLVFRYAFVVIDG